MEHQQVCKGVTVDMAGAMGRLIGVGNRGTAIFLVRRVLLVCGSVGNRHWKRALPGRICKRYSNAAL